MLGKLKYVLKKNLNMKTSYVVGITVLSLFLIVGGISVALYTSQAESRGSLNIVTGELASLMESKDLSNQKLTIKGNEEKVITIEIKNSNNTDMKFNLYYTPVEGVEVKYYEDYDAPPKEEGEIISKKETKKYTLFIKNKNSSDKEIIFGSDVGLKKKELPFPEGKKVINQRKIDVVKDDNMIPVVYDENKKSWVVADEENWYDYDHQKWANAVTLDKNKVLDLSGNNKTGEMVGSPSYSQEGLVLNGTIDGINLKDKLKDLFRTSHTFQIKVKRNDASSSNWDILLGNYNHANSNNYEVRFGGYRIWFNGGRIDKTYGTAKANEFVLITFAYDKENSQLKVYENNTLIFTDQNSLYGEYDYDYVNTYIGRDLAAVGGRETRGTIEKIMFYNKVLTESEISNNIDTEKGKIGDQGIIPENLILYYDFREKKLNPGTPIPMDIIETMWVYVPRYSYTIGSEDGVNYFGKKGEYLSTTPTLELPGEIDVKLISKNKKDTGNAQYKVSEKISNWRTPDAFTFGGKELSGIWVGKFETSSSDPSATNGGGNTTELDPIIKPNITSWRNIQVANIAEVGRKITSSGNRYGFSISLLDSHAMKNSEWGAVAYLSQSKFGKLGNKNYTGSNKEIYQNKSDTYITGCSYGKPSNGNTDYGCQYQYDQVPDGSGASTTGTIYGIYDMSGGALEYVMGNLKLNGEKYSGNTPDVNSGYTGLLTNGDTFNGKSWLDDKYYNFYTTKNAATACNGGVCFSHGLSEVARWYGDANAIISEQYPWFWHGGGYNSDNNISGVFYSSFTEGLATKNGSFRLVLVS